MLVKQIYIHSIFREFFIYTYIYIVGGRRFTRVMREFDSAHATYPPMSWLRRCTPLAYLNSPYTLLRRISSFCHRCVSDACLLALKPYTYLCHPCTLPRFVASSDSHIRHTNVYTHKPPRVSIYTSEHQWKKGSVIGWFALQIVSDYIAKYWQVSDGCRLDCTDSVGI